MKTADSLPPQMAHFESSSLSMSCFIAETGVECHNCGVTCCGLFLNPNVGAMSVLSRLGSQNVPVSCLEMLICFD